MTLKNTGLKGLADQEQIKVLAEMLISKINQNTTYPGEWEMRELYNAHECVEDLILRMYSVAFPYQDEEDDEDY